MFSWTQSSDTVVNGVGKQSCLNHGDQEAEQAENDRKRSKSQTQNPRPCLHDPPMHNYKCALPFCGADPKANQVKTPT